MVKWVNIAKGLAIFLVVYGHVIDGLAEIGEGTFFSYQIQHDVIYAFHMPLFFFLSGLFIKKIEKRTFSNVLKSRGLSLLYPYFLWGIIQGTIMAVLSKFTNSGQSWDSILLLPIDPFGQFWYIYDLFFMSLLFYGLSKFFHDNRINLFVALILFILTPVMNGWEFVRFGHHFIFLVLGSLFFEYEKQFDKHKHSISIILVLLASIAVFIKIELFSFFIFGLLGTLSIIAISKMLVANKPIEYLGEKTFPVYLWHILVVAGGRVFLTRILGFTYIPTLIVTLTILGVTLPILVDLLIRKIHLEHILYGSK